MSDRRETGEARPGPHAPPIDDHRVLGDGCTTALLRPDGEVDWWCAPLPHDAPLLWSLLDPDGGASRFLDVVPRPVEPGSDVREPVAAPVLVTHLVAVEAVGGEIVVTDALLPADVGGSALVRTVRAVAAPTVVRHALRWGGFDGGATDPGDELAVDDLLWCFHAAGAPLHRAGPDLVAELHLDPDDPPAVLVLTADPELDLRTDGLLARVDEALRSCRGDLPATIERRRLVDGLDVLRACTHAPTGALLASPTTSLPEVPGADRQFDYRYTWMRDGSLGAAVASVAGDHEVADGYLRFLEELGPDRILEAPVWTVTGEPIPAERVVDGVDGWAGSRPVRVGNAASTQVQYDALGFVAEAISIVARGTGELPSERWDLVTSIADRVTAHPPGLTAGIWELRQPRALVAADIGSWMALDHALRLSEAFRRPASPGWEHHRERARQRVHAAVLPDGLLPQVHPGTADEEPRADASGLLAVICGLIAPDDPVASRIIDACRRSLATGPFLHRYPPGEHDGFHGIEATFTPATLWVVSALATVGRREEAEELFTVLDADLPRLLAEEWEPTTRRSLGNGPLAWSHIECIRALYALDGSIAA